MLATLAAVKSRLQLSDADPQYDQILTAAITAVSARFDKETNRTLARIENATDELDAAETEIAVSCYPIETVTKFETKTSEAEGWIEQPAPPHLIRRACVISFSASQIVFINTTAPSGLEWDTYMNNRTTSDVTEKAIAVCVRAPA